MKYDLYNPTPARRIYYVNQGAAMKDQKAITVEPGQTLKGIELTKEAVDELNARERKNPGKDLQVKSHEGVEEEPAETVAKGGKK